MLDARSYQAVLPSCPPVRLAPQGLLPDGKSLPTCPISPSDPGALAPPCLTSPVPSLFLNRFLHVGRRPHLREVDHLLLLKPRRPGLRSSPFLLKTPWLRSIPSPPSIPPSSVAPCASGDGVSARSPACLGSSHHPSGWRRLGSGLSLSLLPWLSLESLPVLPVRAPVASTQKPESCPMVFQNHPSRIHDYLHRCPENSRSQALRGAASFQRRFPLMWASPEKLRIRSWSFQISLDTILFFARTQHKKLNNKTGRKPS
jgi:hypothetical protein